MPDKKRADRWCRLFPAVIACVLLVGVAAWASAFLPPSAQERSLEQQQPTNRTLREWNGQIGLFVGDTAEPFEVYDVPVAALPPEEQDRLRGGIIIENEEMLAELLENYTS